MKLRTLLRGAVVLAVTTFAPAAPIAAGAAKPKLPDLSIEMPAKPYNDHVAPIFVDAYEQPGRLLYRFDTVVRNRGGTLDVFRDRETGHVIQAIWPGGVPDPDPDPNVAPSGHGVVLEDRHSHGARFEYVVEQSHQHWHFQVAAAYALEVPGRADRAMPKIGFCLIDSFGPADRALFPEHFTGSGPRTWCDPENPASDFVREGISGVDGGDLYDAATELQWVDITGLAPGRYVVRGTANPINAIHESDRSNNVLRRKRVIPGVLASDALAWTRPGEAVRIPLAARVLAPRIPARSGPDCAPEHIGEGCYTRITASTPVQFTLDGGPSHGTAAITPDGGRAAIAGYTPAAGFSGRDVLRFTATDGRGLGSRPGRVNITVASGRSVLSSLLVRSAGRRATAQLVAPAAVRVSGLLRGKGVKRRLERRRLRAGTGTLALGRLRPGSYRLTLLATSGAARQTVRMSFRLTA